MIAGLVLGALCLWLALRSVQLDEMRAVVTRARVEWLLVAAALLACSFVLRGWRWALVLGVDDREGRRDLVRATGLGYALNSILPARAGDVARSYAAGTALRRPMPLILASTVVERILDACVLAAALLVSVPFLDLPRWIVRAAMVAGAAGLVALVVMAFAARHARGAADRPGVRAPRGLIAGVLADFASGFALIRSAGQAGRVAGATLTVWALDTVLAIALGRAFDVQLSPMEALALLSALGLASAAPSTPGFVGVYQVVAVAVLVPTGASPEAAIALVTALQLITLAVSALVSLEGAATRRMPPVRIPFTRSRHRIDAP